MRLGRHIVAQLGFVLVACGGSTDAGDDANGGPGGDPPESSVVVPPCTQGIYYTGAPGPVDARVRETHSGLNGEFTDTCEDGDLIQYECETTTFTGPPSDPATWTSGTGNVVSKNIDCSGRCVDGACPNACPNVGDRVRCLSVASDGHTRWESITSGWTYECEVNPYNECSSMPGPGDTLDVAWSPPLILTSTDCVTDVYFAVGIGTEASCWYAPCTATAP
jgi:hypothetical protein